MANTKRYPFNMNKHQHDIFYRYNKAKNEMDDKFMAGKLTDNECNEYESLIAGLENLMGYGAGIVWLTGSEYGLAMECVNWAGMMRGRA